MFGLFGASSSRFRAAALLALGSALLLFSAAVVGVAAPQTATWYGPGFEGEVTASGEVFNPDDYTAASKTLAFGTRLIVTYNGSSVVVRVNDRGPYANDADLDLSRAAADAVGLTPVGVATVDVVVADPATPTGPYSAPIPASGGNGAAPGERPAVGGDAGGQYAGGDTGGQGQYPATSTAPAASGANPVLPAAATPPIRMVAVTTDRTGPGYAHGGTAVEQYGQTGGTGCVPGAAGSSGQYVCGGNDTVGGGATSADGANAPASCAPNDPYCAADGTAEGQETTAAIAVANRSAVNAGEQYPADTTQAQPPAPGPNAGGPAQEAPEPLPAAEGTGAERSAQPASEAQVPGPVPVPAPAPAPAPPEAGQGSEAASEATEPPPPAAPEEKTGEQDAPEADAPASASEETAPPSPKPVAVPVSAPAPKQSAQPHAAAEDQPPAAAASVGPRPVVKSAGSKENVPGITELPRTGGPPLAGGFLRGPRGRLGGTRPDHRGDQRSGGAPCAHR